MLPRQAEYLLQICRSKHLGAEEVALTIRDALPQHMVDDAWQTLFASLVALRVVALRVGRGAPSHISTVRIYWTFGFFGLFGQKFGIRGAEHHKRATLTQPSPTSFPVIQEQCTLCDKCCCILPGIYTALGLLQQLLPNSLAP